MQKQIEFTLDEGSAQTVPLVKQLDMDTLTAEALKYRPEMKQMDEEAESTKYEFHAVTRDYFPTVAVTGWYAKYLPDYPVQLQNTWGVGIGATWNLFDGLNTTSRLGELSARLDEKQALLEREKERIVAEVAADYMDLSRAEASLSVAQNALDAATENLKYAQKRYEAAVGTILELLIAETSMVDSQAIQIQAKYGYSISLATLETAVNAPLMP